MNKDQKQSSQDRNDIQKPVAIAYAGFVSAPIWLSSTLEAGVPTLGFLFVRVGDDGDSSGLFQPADLFDMLVVIQMLAEKTCLAPHLDLELRLRLENLAIELAILRKRQEIVKREVADIVKGASRKEDSSQ